MATPDMGVLLLSEGRRFEQLRLQTIRHFPEMIRQSLRKDLSRVRSPLLGVELVWYRLTALA